MKTGQLAQRLDVSPGTIRFWADEYTEFLSAGARGRTKGAKRRYTEHDGLVLATVAELRNTGLAHEQIQAALKEGRLVEELPPLPTPEEEEARQAIALVPISELHRALDQIRVMQNEIGRLIEERDRALASREEEVKSLNQRIARLNQELGRARGVMLGSIGVIILLLAGAIALAVLLAKYLPLP